jgi:hypothetical protein
MKAEAIKGGGYEVTATGLLVTEGMSLERWEAMGQTFGLYARSHQWIVADWLLWGEGAFGERHAQALNGLGVEPHTLSIWRWVASRVTYDRRRPGLSWSHHVEVARLTPDMQKYWLDRAEREGLTVSSLRAGIAGKEAAAPPAPERGVGGANGFASEIGAGLGANHLEAAKRAWAAMTAHERTAFREWLAHAEAPARN